VWESQQDPGLGRVREGARWWLGQVACGLGAMVAGAMTGSCSRQCFQDRRFERGTPDLWQLRSLSFQLWPPNRPTSPTPTMQSS
jgi:hypothetical protein